MPLFTNKISAAPWDEWVNRVIIHVPHYLSYTGDLTAGGRQRQVRDLAVLIKETWGREVLIVQKASKGFEKYDPNGIHVIGIKARLDVFGDPLYGYRACKLIAKGDAYLSIGQEDAWPFFVLNSKGMHTGVWWDGPHPRWKQNFNAIRTLAMITAYRSMWCVDTNIINWIRSQGHRGYALAKKCIYTPNCVDLNSIQSTFTRTRPNIPLRILFARRYEKKRGGELFLDALLLLKKRGVPFYATLSTALGQAGEDEVHGHIKARGLKDCVNIVSHNMNNIFSEYQNADIAVIPTLWSEGTSYSCVEAIASGLPVIVTPVGGLANLVVPGFNGLIPPPTPTAFADAIYSLTDPHVWLKLHNNCLSMQDSLSKKTWDKKVIDWLKS